MSKTAKHDHGPAPAGRRARAGQDPACATRRVLRIAASILAATMAVAACGPFSASATAESCLVSAMKSAEPFGNARERAETETQLRHFCKLAAGA